MTQTEGRAAEEPLEVEFLGYDCVPAPIGRTCIDLHRELAVLTRQVHGRNQTTLRAVRRVGVAAYCRRRPGRRAVVTQQGQLGRLSEESHRPVVVVAKELLETKTSTDR